MTPQAQRIAIAEARGFFNFREITKREGEGEFAYSWEVLVGTTRQFGETEVPNYLIDLNAMHEAEMTLSSEQRHFFRRFFYNWGKGNGRGYGESICHATAAQRAEAFLRTLNKWDDSK